MTLKNFVRALKLLTGRKPFRPFAIELNTGTQFLVKHPELVEIHRDLIAFMDPH